MLPPDIRLEFFFPSARALVLEWRGGNRKGGQDKRGIGRLVAFARGPGINMSRTLSCRGASRCLVPDVVSAPVAWPGQACSTRSLPAV